MSPFTESDNPQQYPFRKYAHMYILAILGITWTIIFRDVYLQQYLKDKMYISRTVNLGGRQRMLSQKLTKNAVLLRQVGAHEFEERKRIVQEDFEDWSQVHYDLQHGNKRLNIPSQNSAEIRAKFNELNPYFNGMSAVILDILQIPYGDPSLDAAVNKLLKVERDYLDSMDKVVFQYDHEAVQKMKKLNHLQWVMLIVALAILALEVVFIFWPTTAHIRKITDKLGESEQQAKRMYHELQGLYGKLEKAYKNEQAINSAIGKEHILGRMNPQGKLIYASKKLADWMGHERNALLIHFEDVFVTNNHEPGVLSAALSEAQSGELWHDQLLLHDADGNDLWLDVSLVPVSGNGKRVEKILILGANITTVKLLAAERATLELDEVQSAFKTHKERASFILFAQEEERKRIARDLHDGIGQMLTALKFELEAIDPYNGKRTEIKLAELRQPLRDLIIEVRRISHNLNPNVLTDYGLIPALRNFAKEMTQYSGKSIIFENQSGFNQRLSQITETNLYRIVQEAVNNALKYSEGECIEIVVAHNRTDLTIVIKDNGEGFDLSSVKEGNGLGNIRERTSYANGQCEIITSPTNGTQITVKVPI